MLKRVIPQTLAWTALAVLCGAVALAQAAPSAAPQAAETRTDGQIEMDVVHALDASTELKNDLITAATIQGEVTLTGSVSTDASRQLAESIASHVPGVTKVNNSLTVGNAQAEAPAPGPEPMAGNAPQNPDNSMAMPAPSNPGGPLAVPNQSDAQLRAQIRAEVRAEMQAEQAQRNQAPKGPVTIPAGALLQLRTAQPVSNKGAKEGEPVQFTVIRDVVSGGVLAIPRGATIHGVVTYAKKAGELAGSPELALQLTSLDLGGQTYPLESNLFKVKGPGKGGLTANNVVGGGLLGAMIGGIAGRGPGAAIGAAAGAGVGIAASAATPGPRIWIPSEALVEFHLKAPLTVTPVGPQEAARLSQGLYPGGPALYRRGYYPYGSPYYAGYPYYPYYRPYYVVGGAYYWR
jgi:hypothetical protein